MVSKKPFQPNKFKNVHKGEDLMLDEVESSSSEVHKLIFDLPLNKIGKAKVLWTNANPFEICNVHDKE
jgi:hypothetical protein